MAEVRLVAMRQGEYEAWHDDQLESYAQDHEKSDGVTAAEALASARREFAALLPQGLDTPGMHLFTAVDAERGEPVGMVWVAERGGGPSRQAFIYDIAVRPELRGRGYGRATLTAAEAEARRLGLSRIGLHVFGHNEVAIRLYETSGYRVTNLVMAKEL